MIRATRFAIDAHSAVGQFSGECVWPHRRRRSCRGRPGCARPASHRIAHACSDPGDATRNNRSERPPARGTCGDRIMAWCAFTNPKSPRNLARLPSEPGRGFGKNLALKPKLPNLFASLPKLLTLVGREHVLWRASIRRVGTFHPRVDRRHAVTTWQSYGNSLPPEKPRMRQSWRRREAR
jgi:hypothetical protein